MSKCHSQLMRCEWRDAVGINLSQVLNVLFEFKNVICQNNILNSYLNGDVLLSILWCSTIYPVTSPIPMLLHVIRFSLLLVHCILQWKYNY